MRENLIYIISGPSGVGKTTLLKKLFLKKEIKDKFLLGISFTTRKKRDGEEEGKDYFFVTKEKFKELENKGFFLETQEVLGDYYGTPNYFLERAEKEGKHLILCIDVKGGMYLKKQFRRGKIITIFISVPDKEELYRRLQKRVEKVENIEKRINLAEEELKFLKHYDYLIINQDLSQALKKLETILKSVAQGEHLNRGVFY